MHSLRRLLRVTAVRLTIVYTVLFGTLSLGLVVYVSYNTGQLIIGQIRAAADEEVDELATIYQSGGASQLIRSIDRRSRNPGAYLYLVSDARGRIITGNVKNVDPALLQKGGWSSTPFPYEPIEGSSSETHRAIAQVFDLPDGLRLLVGRDIGDANNFRSVIGRAFTVALVAMLMLGLVLWLVIGRRALRRIDDVSRSSSRILGGDLSQRLPISGADDEFDRLSENLNQLIARIEKLNSGVRNMSDSIAHDLKTPLTRLRNRADLALNTDRMSKRDRDSMLRNVIDDADALIRTFDALLTISQVNSGARTVEFTDLDLKEVASAIHELFEPAAEEANIELQMHSERVPQVRANRELLNQAITNLMDNAFKYGSSRDNAVIAITVTADGPEASISVADNGPGIAEADHLRVRERFVRLDPSRTTPGTGLGLALVDAVVKLHDGNLILEDNEPGLIAKLVFPTSSSLG